MVTSVQDFDHVKRSFYALLSKRLLSRWLCNDPCDWNVQLQLLSCKARLINPREGPCMMDWTEQLLFSSKQSSRKHPHSSSQMRLKAGTMAQMDAIYSEGRRPMTSIGFTSSLKGRSLKMAHKQSECMPHESTSMGRKVPCEHTWLISPGVFG